MFSLLPCPKNYAKDQDKAVSPAETLHKVRARLNSLDISILSEVKRIDNGRLGIPVYLSVVGRDAGLVMPTRKQMGKGASPEQAQASALMELIERYSYFTFWRDCPEMVQATYSQALAKFGADQVMPVTEILKSVDDNLDEARARRILDLTAWKFFPVLEIGAQQTLRAPLDWFRKLSEFNGSSAGNTDVESILQGACELMERHVSQLADFGRPVLPTIDPQSVKDPVLLDLWQRFSANGIKVRLKDFSFNYGVPVVAALAWDPATFPDKSEVVFTAGSASSPAKAAIRALTEVAQLAGDFNSSACYEASGLSKYAEPEQADWLLEGPLVPLDSINSFEAPDILTELQSFCRLLAGHGLRLYSIATTNPALGIPAHYSFIPGAKFRERDKHASLGLFVGRILAEEAEPDAAMAGLKTLSELIPQAHYLDFFQGILALRLGDAESALGFFAKARPAQPDPDSRALACFYHAYTLTQRQEWQNALPDLDAAVADCPDMKEYLNLRGVCRFKLKDYESAARDFREVITRLDKGSVMDLANLGLCLKFMGRKEEAGHYLAAALKLDPSLEFARNHLKELG